MGACLVALIFVGAMWACRSLRVRMRLLIASAAAAITFLILHDMAVR